MSGNPLTDGILMLAYYTFKVVVEQWYWCLAVVGAFLAGWLV